MNDIGLNLNRGRIRRFDYSNLPIHNVKIAPTNNGIISAENNLPNIIQTFGANNLAKIQNTRSEATYVSDLSGVTINPNVTLSTENLINANLNSVVIGDNNFNLNADVTTENLNIANLTNFVTLTSV